MHVCLLCVCFVGLCLFNMFLYSCILVCFLMCIFVYASLGVCVFHCLASNDDISNTHTHKGSWERDIYLLRVSPNQVGLHLPPNVTDKPQLGATNQTHDVTVFGWVAMDERLWKKGQSLRICAEDWACLFLVHEGRLCCFHHFTQPSFIRLHT